MANQFHSLPPNKRFRHLHQDSNFPASSFLPAKKRKDPPPIFANSEPVTVTTLCLPAKKRICALHPNLDLNLEYDPKSELDEIQEIEEDGVVCAVCQSTDGDPMDPIVFCDGCDLTVHATCYGNPLRKGVPEGDWFCCQCEFDDKNKSLTCCLCGVNGGALKPTNDSRWAHIVCALFIPEVFFGDPDGREEIDCSKVPKKRWGGKCYVCKKLDGCVLDCSEEKCGLRFHVTCGLKEDLCIEYKEGRSRGAIVAGFCKSHSELWMKQQATGKYKIVARNEE